MLEVVLQKLVLFAVNTGTKLLGERIKKINADLEKKSEIGGKLKPLHDKGLRADVIKNIAAADVRLCVAEPHVVALLADHVRVIQTWSQEVNFRDLRGAKRLITSYVELDTYLMPKEMHYDASERQHKRRLLESLVSTSSHNIVLGVPGAGKTTSMKKLCSLHTNVDSSSLPRSIPILIRFRSLPASDSDNPLRDELMKLIPFKLSIGGQVINPASGVGAGATQGGEIACVTSEAYACLLDGLDALLILDGFDEIPDLTVKRRVLEEIRFLTARLEKTRVLITCRTGEFPYSIDRTATYEIADLNHAQIAEFAHKWLGERAPRFLEEIVRGPYYDTAIRPLTLAHLCAIYDRIGRIPDRPKTIYRKVVSLLLEEWDEQRSIIRTSAYATKFETDRKFEFLCALAYELTANGIQGQLTSQQLAAAYLAICEDFGLEKSEAESIRVAKEIESHTGLFVRAGYESFEFAHKSIQEYLTAEFLVKLPDLRASGFNIQSFAAELAIATSISSKPTRYFSSVVFSYRHEIKYASRNFFDPFIQRVTLERPDFYACDDMVLALFHILSHGIYNVDDHFVFEFVKSALTRSGSKALSWHYQWGKADGDIIRLERRREHPVLPLKAIMEINVMQADIAAIFKRKFVKGRWTEALLSA